MSKTFYAEGINGNACLFTGADDVIVTPTNRLDDVYFHTKYKYFRETLVGNASVSFPIFGASDPSASPITSPAIEVVQKVAFDIPAANRGTFVFTKDSATGKPIPLQYNQYLNNGNADGSFALRFITFRILPTQIIVASRCRAYMAYCPAYTLNFSYFFGVVA